AHIEGSRKHAKHLAAALDYARLSLQSEEAILDALVILRNVLCSTKIPRSLVKKTADTAFDFFDTIERSNTTSVEIRNLNERIKWDRMIGQLIIIVSDPAFKSRRAINRLHSALVTALRRQNEWSLRLPDNIRTRYNNLVRSYEQSNKRHPKEEGLPIF